MRAAVAVLVHTKSFTIQPMQSTINGVSSDSITDSPKSGVCSDFLDW